LSIDVSATEERLGLHPEPYLAIAGERRHGGGRATRSVVNPVTGKVLGQVPLATAQDLKDALAATARGFDLWSSCTAYERSAVLRQTATYLREHRDAGALRISLELGKVFSEALAEVDVAASMFEWAADEAVRAYGRLIPGRRPGLRLEARLRPIGPVYAVSSWNAPLNTPARKLSGALAAGCSVILKLSDQVPTAGLFLFEALEASGLPPEVVQVVTGRGAEVSDAIVPSDIIRMVTLTGSIELGRQLASQAARYLKPQTMELGGHAPAVIHHDVDVPTVARTAARAKFRNVGQVCTAPTRFLVHRNISGQFTEELVAETERLTVGDPFSQATDLGPLQSEKHLAEIESLVADASRRGAMVACGGKRLDSDGFFYAPTVLTDIPEGADVKTVEPFGPIALVEEYSQLEDAVAQANSLPVGLSAYGFTASGSVADYLASRIDAGNIVLNNWNSSHPETPFGGVRDSGYGREGGSEGLREFLTTIFVSNEFPPQLKEVRG
jgi:succinate-semialdehyde dehydrogenase / glutarate-semialdehyde dehydrogenase